MPTITNPGVIRAMVTGYLIKDLDMGVGLRDAGYSESYSKSAKGLKLYERCDVKAEIKRQQLDLIKKTGYSKEQAQLELEEARTGAMAGKQYSAAVSAINTNMRLHGMDQMQTGETVQIVINPPKQAKTVSSEVIENE